MASCEVSKQKNEDLLSNEKEQYTVKKDLENGDDDTDKDDLGVYEDEEEGDETEIEDQLQKTHPLQNRWALWFFKNDRSNSWTDNLKKVVEFGTVEDFWGLVNHITPASNLPTGCDYSLFKSGIEPMWEDKGNINGGRWLISVDKPHRSTNLDHYWIDILMLLIGEAFDEDSDEICGAVVNIRNKGDRLSLWTANCEATDSIMRIGKKIKDCLDLRVQISYQSHDDQQKRTGSKARSTFNI